MSINLGLAMIVNKGSPQLRLCVDSVAQFTRQIVIVDTSFNSGADTSAGRAIASAADTSLLAIAQEFGATLVPFPWTDHFADARNAGLREMKTDWILVLDADEDLEPGAQARITALIESHGDAVGGFHVTSRHYMPTRYVHTLRGISMPNQDQNPRARSAPSWVETGVCRLFRRHPGIFFTGRIHEKVEPQIHRLGMSIQPANFCIRHYGRLVSPEDRRAKDLYYYSLCRSSAEEQPQNAEAWLEAGLVAFESIGDMVEAQRSLSRAIAINRNLPVASLVLAMIHLRQGRFVEALRASDSVPDAQPLGILKHSSRGDAFHALNRLREAQRAYRKALDLGRQSPELESCSSLLDLESKLGYTNIGLGLIEPGLDRLRRASQQAPHSFGIQERLMKGFLLAGRIRDAAEISIAIARTFRDPRLYIRCAAIQIQAARLDQAKSILNEGIAEHPSDSRLVEMRRQLQIPAAT